MDQEGPMNERDAKFITRQIFSAIHYLHSNNIVHRDIKPDNIMIEDMTDESKIIIKLIDFGFAKELDKGAMFSQQLGSDHYLAPEVIRGDLYDEKIDIWSATICIYIMLCEYLPFYGKGSEEIYKSILNKEINF